MYYILMLSLSLFAIPRKTKLSVQIIMTLDKWPLTYLSGMSLLLLRFMRFFVTLKMTGAPLRTSPGLFRSLLWTWVFIRSCQISFFFTIKSEELSIFWYVFILVLNFSKELKSCQTLFTISARSLVVFPDFFKVFNAESESPSSNSLFDLNISFGLPASSLPSSTWRLTLSSYSCSNSLPDLYLLFSFLSTLALEELILIFWFYFSYLFLMLTFCFWWRIRTCSIIIKFSTFLKSLPFILGSGRTFFCYITGQTPKQRVWEEVVVILLSRLYEFHFRHLPFSKETIIISRKNKN